MKSIIENILMYILAISIFSVGRYIRCSVYGDSQEEIKKELVIGIVGGTIIFITIKVIIL